MGFCKTLVRAILIIFNILFLLAGLFLLGFGIALKVAPTDIFKMFTNIFKENDIGNFLDGVTDPVAIGMIVLGCIVAVIAFLGILGAITLKKLFLVPYVMLVILILAAEIILIILVVVLPEKFSGYAVNDFSKQDSVFTQLLQDGVNYAAEPPKDVLGKAWYFVQNTFACCGWTKDSNFADAKKTVSTANGVASFDLARPSSCCKQKNFNGSPLPIWNNTIVFEDFAKCKDGTQGFFNTDGCFNSFFFNASKIPVIILGISLGLEVVLILCAIVALCQKTKVHV